MQNVSKFRTAVAVLSLMATALVIQAQTIYTTNYTTNIVTTTSAAGTTAVTNIVPTSVTSVTVMPVGTVLVPTSGTVGTGVSPATNPPTPSGAIKQLGQWLGNINTNYHYQDVILWDGPVYENQLNFANEIGASVDLWHSDKTASTNTMGTLFLAPETRIREAGINSVWLSEGAGLEFGWQKCSFRGGVFMDGVYLNHPEVLQVAPMSRLNFEGGIFADQMISASTAAGLMLSYQSHQKYPLVGVNFQVSFGNGSGLFGMF